MRKRLDPGIFPFNKHGMPAVLPAFLLLAALFLPACGSRDSGLHLEGMQGTAVWHVTISHPPAGMDAGVVRSGIDSAFAESTRLIASWRQDSEISRFNQYRQTDWFPVSPKVAGLVSMALQLSEQSHGAYDITVGPLIRLWGFNANGITSEVPEADDIEATRARVGYKLLQVSAEQPALRKLRPDVEVELASLADGFAADLAGEYLESLGVEDYMVEIAGEIRTRGLSPRGDAWRVAIEKPQEEGRDIQLGIEMQDAGLATSGDYRNYFMQGGKRYSHTLDPATGYPVTHSLASVSVMAKQAALADAYATLLMAMGEEAGVKLADSKGIAAYFIWRTDVGFDTYATDVFYTALPKVSDR